MASVESNGTQTATLTTEHTLVTWSTAGTRVLVVDLTNMAAGDYTEIRIKLKASSGGSEILHSLVPFSGAQAEPLLVSVPIPVGYGGSCSLKQTVGTGRSYAWHTVRL